MSLERNERKRKINMRCSYSKQDGIAFIINVLNDAGKWIIVAIISIKIWYALAFHTKQFQPNAARR